MELLELKSMWQSYDSKLEKTLKLNLHCLELIQTQKVRSKLVPLFWQRIMEVTLHGIAILLLVAFIYKNFSRFSYAASGTALLAFYVVAFANSLKQIMIIKRMDYSNDVVTIQGSLLMLQTHSVNYARLIFLFLPTLLAYPVVLSKVINDFDLQFIAQWDLLAQYHGNWFNVQLIATIAMLPVCIWLYTQVSYRNIHKQWVKDTIHHASGAGVVKAIEFVKELESLKRDVV